MDQYQRDLGRVETKVEYLQQDTAEIKKDLADIKKTLVMRSAVKESDWKRLTLVGLIASIVTHSVNWIRPFL